MPFPDYFDLVEPLILPIRGKQYRIRAVSALDMARWTKFRADVAPRLQAGETVSDDERISDDEFYRMFLGDALDEMRADGVLPAVILHAARTAHTDALHGREVAETVWADTDPKAPEQAPKPPRKPTDRKPSRSTAAAAKTPRRASSSGTTSRSKRAGS
jgi:hypothetical protein